MDIEKLATSAIDDVISKTDYFKGKALIQVKGKL